MKFLSSNPFGARRVRTALVLPANGNVVAWQEAVIGPEISNYRITEVLVQVGDAVSKGQVLALIPSESMPRRAPPGARRRFASVPCAP